MNVDEWRKCARCKKTKLVSEFWKRKNRPSGFSYHCKVCATKVYKAWARKNNHGVKSYNVWYRKKNIVRLRANDRRKAYLRRLDVLQTYTHRETGEIGPFCCCPCGCDVSVVRALTMDHIGGGGGAHRKSLGGGSPTHGSGLLYRWLQKNHYPDGFRVLCTICNFTKFTGRKCAMEKAGVRLVQVPAT